MPRRTAVQPITATQARYILGKLIDEGKVSADDVTRHLSGMWQELTFVEKRLEELRAAAGAVQPVKRIRGVAKRARARLSPEVQQSRALQGQYIGLLRQVPEGDRKRFQDLAKTKGREVAVSALKRRLGK